MWSKRNNPFYHHFKKHKVSTNKPTWGDKVTVLKTKQNEKTTYRMGENIYKLNDLRGINLQNIQTAHEALY